ncbi:MAG TPA: ATPase, T2SS/T4P/T4SS family [Candidatus Nitrosotalea sp.]|nr:ATPase, T2SS/T4P/T4SS family [Candidatus Nitrosotalea sp.]
MVVSAEQAELRIRARVEQELAERLERRQSARLRLGDQDWVYRMIGALVSEEHTRPGSDLDLADCPLIWRRVFGAVTPLGPLAEYLGEPEVEEVRINGTRSCFLIRDSRRLEVPPPFASEAELIELVQWYADGAGGARLDRASPTVTLTLPDGSRLHAALSPPASPMSVTIRRHPPARFQELQDLVRAGFLPEPATEFLEAAVRARLNMLVAGGTGAGKTTFMRTLGRLIPEHERVVTIEDHAELHLWRELKDCIALEGRSANIEGRGAISIQMLVHEALRMSPDRIVIGEVRGAEALDLLDAMNTGHPGSISTIHSDSPRDTLPRLVRLALRNPQAPPADAVTAEVARSVELVMQASVDLSGGRRQRYLSSIGWVAGTEAGRPVVQELMAAEVREGTRSWRRLASCTLMPRSMLDKLSLVSAPERLLDGLDG